MNNKIAFFMGFTFGVALLRTCIILYEPTVKIAVKIPEETHKESITYSHVTEYTGEAVGCQVYLDTVMKDDGVVNEVMVKTVITKCPNIKTENDNVRK